MMGYKLSFTAKLEEVDSRFNACGTVQSFTGSVLGEDAITLAEALGIALPEEAVQSFTPAVDPVVEEPGPETIVPEPPVVEAETVQGADSVAG
jgi:hypothetical protein